MTEQQRQRFSGRDVAEAVAAARRHFNVSRQDLLYEVTEERKVGPLEQAGQLVHIEAWPAPGARPASEGGPPPRRDEPRGGGRRDRRERGGRGRRERGEPGPPVPAEPVDLPPLLPPGESVEPGEFLAHLARSLIAGLDLQLDVDRVDQDEIGVRVYLEGEDVQHLLDADAEGLDALQYLANRILQKDGRLKVRVSFEAGGYRAEHEQRLIDQALQLADQVRSEGKPRRMPAVGPYERRLVHVALADVEGIRTYSTGSGYNRRLHIAPASASSAGEDPEAED
jgi:spoIIIJ-associated protein